MAVDSPPNTEFDPLDEIEAMRAVSNALTPLPIAARDRILTWAMSALGQNKPHPQLPHGPITNRANESQAHTQTPIAPTSAPPPIGAANYSAFADLLGDSGAQTDTDRALVGGYWLQVVRGNEDFFSISVNEALKDTGNAVGNITRAFDGLKNTKPQLVRQLEKTGKTQQARKRFKLTTAGTQRVEKMLRGQSDD